VGCKDTVGCGVVGVGVGALVGAAEGQASQAKGHSSMTTDPSTVLSHHLFRRFSTFVGLVG
jgi:hypothetical protein